MRKTGLAISDFEEGKFSEYGWPLEAGDAKEMDSFLESLKGMHPCQDLRFRPVKSCLNFDFQDCKIIHFCCSKQVMYHNLLQQKEETNTIDHTLIARF